VICLQTKEEIEERKVDMTFLKKSFKERGINLFNVIPIDPND